MEIANVRVKKGDFWRGLECISTGEGLMADWEWAFGSAVDSVVPLLRPTEKESDSFPCPARPACECRHEIQETDFGLVAMCMCGSAECQSVVVEPKDIVVHRFDVNGFGKVLRQALGFSEPDGSAYASLGLQEIGRYASVAAPVYFSLARSNLLLREVQKLLGLREGPFLLLTPTGSGWSPDVEALARAQGGGHIALSAVLDVDAEGRLVPKGTVVPMLDEFARRVASLRDASGTLRNIHQEIAAVRKDFGELRTAKQRLEKMLADGMFTFAGKIDAASFRVLCAILAAGDMAKASRTLEVSEDSIRSAVRRWADRGKEYQTMVELVRWRKKSGGREKVPLNDAILHERAEAVDYPGLLSDVLDGLLSMNDENWDERCQELAELLRPIVREAGR